MSEELRVMVVGAGAREHVLAEAYEHSPDVKDLVVAPGNDYIAHDLEKEVQLEPNVSLDDPDSILEAAKKHQPDLIDVAQDNALAAGTVDVLERHGFTAFGPNKSGARIESDKQWSREFMVRHGIPTPEFQSFSQADRASVVGYLQGQYWENPRQRLFIKAAGLCAGKGALEARSFEEAVSRIDELRDFGLAGEHFVIEDGLEGEEYSYYAITDGVHFQTFKSAQDHKLSHDGDTGEQTGGMGVVSPAEPTRGIEAGIESRQIGRAIDGLAKEGRSYKGVLYLGGIRTEDGLQTIEYNARWGDPEVQTILPGVTSDYLELVQETLAGELDRAELNQDDRARVCVVGAAKGYPGEYERGLEITGLGRAGEVEGVRIYGAAIAVRDGKFYADGGRLFSVVGSGADQATASSKAYEAMAYIAIEGDNLHYRTDIGR